MFLSILISSLFFAFFLQDGRVSGFELVSLQVDPPRPRIGDEVRLSCSYTLDQEEALYSLKWNKKDSNDEDREFYRFSSLRPTKQKFPLPDLDVDVSNVLHNFSFLTTRSALLFSPHNSIGSPFPPHNSIGSLYTQLFFLPSMRTRSVHYLRWDLRWTLSRGMVKKMVGKNILSTFITL